MDDRKYKYESPKDSGQYIEAVYEELSLFEWEHSGRRPSGTIRDHIFALLEDARARVREQKREKESERDSISFALGTLGGCAILLLIISSVNADYGSWFYNYSFGLKLWGIAIGAVFIGVSIERSAFFKCIWAFGFTKVTASIAVSALLVFSTGKAASLINGMFPVDASALPLTRTIVTGLLAIQYASPVLFVVGLCALFHAVRVGSWIKMAFTKSDDYSLPPIQSFLFLFLSLAVLGSYFFWVRKDFSNEAWPPKIYQLAHTLDFNGNYACSNIPAGQSVLFLGSNHTRVLVDQNAPPAESMKSFVDSSISNSTTIPPRFRVQVCDVVPPNTHTDKIIDGATGPQS